MSSEVASAVIAGSVSLLVAAVSYLTTRRTLRRDHERQTADHRRAMTARLYDARVATYPELFEATSAFRWSLLTESQDLSPHLRDALERVDRWHGNGGGLLLSDHAYECLMALRRTIRSYLGGAGDDVEEIWMRKNDLRRAMRTDLGLMFGEDLRSSTRR